MTTSETGIPQDSQTRHECICQFLGSYAEAESAVGEPAPTDQASLMLRAAIAVRQEASMSVGGRCMEPILQEGDRILVVKIPLADLRKGDLVVRPGIERPVVHRVMGVHGNHLHSKADESTLPDTDSGAIYGIVRTVWRNGRSISTDSRVYRLLASFVAGISSVEGQLAMSLCRSYSSGEAAFHWRQRLYALRALHSAFKVIRRWVSIFLTVRMSDTELAKGMAPNDR